MNRWDVSGTTARFSLGIHIRLFQHTAALRMSLRVFMLKVCLCLILVPRWIIAKLTLPL